MTLQDCDISRCEGLAYWLVRFQHRDKPYPYCNDHVHRWKKISSRWNQVRIWPNATHERAEG